MAVETSISSSTEYEGPEEKKVSVIVKRSKTGQVVMTFYEGGTKEKLTEEHWIRDITLEENVAKNLGEMLVKVAAFS